MPPRTPLTRSPDPAHDGLMETWTFVAGVVAIIGTLGGLIGLLMRQNSQAHALIGQRIDDTKNDLSKRMEATNKRIDDARDDLGTRIGATDKRIDDLRADNREVHNDLRTILQALVRPPSGQ